MRNDRLVGSCIAALSGVGVRQYTTATSTTSPTTRAKSTATAASVTATPAPTTSTGTERALSERGASSREVQHGRFGTISWCRSCPTSKCW